MCTRPKVSRTTIETVNKPREIIKNPTQADAAKQKAGFETRLGRRGIISENIKTTNNGIEEDIEASKQ